MSDVAPPSPSKTDQQASANCVATASAAAALLLLFLALLAYTTAVAHQNRVRDVEWAAAQKTRESTQAENLKRWQAAQTKLNAEHLAELAALKNALREKNDELDALIAHPPMPPKPDWLEFTTPEFEHNPTLSHYDEHEDITAFVTALALYDFRRQLRVLPARMEPDHNLAVFLGEAENSVYAAGRIYWWEPGEPRRECDWLVIGRPLHPKLLPQSCEIYFWDDNFGPRQSDRFGPASADRLSRHLLYQILTGQARQPSRAPPEQENER